MAVQLFYFSGSGNTLKVTIRVKETFEKLGYECVVHRMEDGPSIDFEDATYVGLLFPVAIQSTFPLVWSFIDTLPNGHGQRIFMIDTMEAFSGGVVGPLKKVLVNKGYECLAAKELVMTNSMGTKPLDRAKEERKNNRALDQAEIFVHDLLEGKGHWTRVPVLSDWMRSISRHKNIWIKESQRIRVNDNFCVACGLCARRCPTGASSITKDGVTIDHHTCISCMRCVHGCPQDAFLVKGKKVQRLIG